MTAPAPNGGGSGDGKLLIGIVIGMAIVFVLALVVRGDVPSVTFVGTDPSRYYKSY